MSDALLNAGRQTLMLELQEASRLPERPAMILSAPLIRLSTVKAKSLSPVLVNQVILAKKIAATLASTGTPAFCASGGSAARRLRDDRKP